uniref:Col_cuticle_N domain-containing protein n=1 Tax=Steinernema glaseri TaxID=37863 RepID=A0A1I7ZD53_9BILA
MELTDLEIQQLKEHNQRRVKQVVCTIAVIMTLVCVALIALSLSLGPKIDQMVSESLDSKLSSQDLFLGPRRNESSINSTLP